MLTFEIAGEIDRKINIPQQGPAEDIDQDHVPDQLQRENWLPEMDCILPGKIITKKYIFQGI